jgi:hypothetical protein
MLTNLIPREAKKEFIDASPQDPKRLIYPGDSVLS